MFTEAATGRNRTTTAHLTDSYHKAYRNYILMSALFAALQLLGSQAFDLVKANLHLDPWQNPYAVNIVLLLLIFYFCFKLIVEWTQCNSESRNNGAAKLDYAFAHLTAVTALTISIVRYLWSTQIIARSSEIMIGTMIGSLLATILLLLWGYKSYTGTRFALVTIFQSVILVFPVIVAVTAEVRRMWGTFIGTFVGVIFIITVYIAYAIEQSEQRRFH